jgi:hypothetical protein
MPHQGGCQCGKHKYEMDVLEYGHVCHCRMCQRATGGLFAALVGAPKNKFRWLTAPAPVFASSNLASRAFCADCGTPLGFTYNRETSYQYVTIGSLDHPETVTLTEQFGIEAKLPFVEFCEDLPKKATGEGQSADGLAFLAQMKKQQA